MKIVVLVKHVPDTGSQRSFTADLTVDRSAPDCRLSELDEYAIEQALLIVEKAGGGEITFLTMGPAGAGESLRKAMSMGGNAGVHVMDDRLHGSDAVATSLVLAKALETLDWDLAICGMSSTDAGMAVVPAMLAERLGVAGLTLASSVVVEGSTVSIRRDGDDASIKVAASLPAIVSVTDQTGEARYPSFKGIMAAKKKPIVIRTLTDLGVDPSEVGLAAAWSIVEGIAQRPPRAPGVVVKDEGDGGAKLADFLSAGSFI